MGLLQWLGSHFSGLTSATSSKKRIPIEDRNRVIYAIGDVHGCYDELLRLEDRIIQDSATLDLPATIIMMGDYISRGPNSAKVLDHLIAEGPIERRCLMGNHEAAFCAFLTGKLTLHDWLQYGAAQTLYSYGIAETKLDGYRGNTRELRSYVKGQIPEAHIAFLEALPLMFYSDSTVFVHAGIRPGIPLNQQKESDLLTIRTPFIDPPHPDDPRVVHGHTPVKEACLKDNRINVDTGAYKTGILSAARIKQDDIKFLSITRTGD